MLRYDKRGVGQSGGRIEAATLQDYADDVIAIVKWLGKRDDVDPRRITVAGHSEGGSVGMLAATRESKIASLVLMATIGSVGADLILEQQRHQLDLMKVSDAERQEKVDLQQKVQAAVISGQGWEGIPPEVRKQADTPWFRSLLQFDPAKVMPKVKQPILIIQGDLDTQVAPHACGEARGAGARAQERRRCRDDSPARRESSARQGDDRRGPGIQPAHGEGDQPGGGQHHRHVAAPVASDDSRVRWPTC